MMRKRGLILLFLIIAAVAVLVMAIPETDEDGDGYCPFAGTDCPAALDCNDNNPDVSPVAEEMPGDGLDNDCNGIVDDACMDADNDGYSTTASAGGADCGGEASIDCDDANIYINPGVAEVCDDGIDNNCNGKTDAEDGACVESSCTLHEDLSFWINCDADEITSANEGDSVYMLLWAEGCDEDSDVEFRIYEHSPGDESLEDTVEAAEVMTNVPDEEGNPTDVDVWVAPWIASYIEDDDDTGPEYYFTGRLTEDGSYYYEASSGKTADTLLSVEGCDGCGIECTLDTGSLGGGGQTLLTPDCLPDVDCTTAPWSSCDSSTGKMTRDVELCTASGTGSVECMEDAKMRMAAEKLCSSSSNPLGKSSTGPGIGECGDGICDAGEECGLDCGEAGPGFPWIWVIAIIIVAGAVTTAVIYLKKKNMPVKKPEPKKMPFAQQKDLDAILSYIRAAKAKGYKDEQITEALKKAGWKDEQVKFAFESINKPAEAAKQTAKPDSQPLNK